MHIILGWWLASMPYHSFRSGHHVLGKKKKKKKKKTEIKDADCHSIHYVMNGILYQLEMLVRYSLIRKALTIAKGSMDAHGQIDCLIVQPPLFDHHRRVGYLSFLSDIANHGQGVVEKLSTDGIRWSTQVNLWKLIMREYHDLYTLR